MHHPTTYDDAMLADIRPRASATCDSAGDDPWAEHGWGLDARGVAWLLGVVGIAAVVARFVA